MNMLLQAGALDDADQDSLERLAATTGVSSSMIQSMISAQKKKYINPQLVQNVNDNGDVTLTLIDGNTGNIINSQVLEGVSTTNVKATGGTTTMADSLSDLYKLREQAEKAGQNTSWYDQQIAQITGSSPSSTSSSGLTSLEQSSLDAALALKGLSFERITGLKNPLNVISGDDEAAMAQFNTLISNLELSKTEYLKGNMSDKDMAILADTIPLNTSLSNKDFETNLKKIISELQKKTGGTSSSYTNYVDLANGYVSNYWQK
jgi:hypothetical protein